MSKIKKFNVFSVLFLLLPPLSLRPNIVNKGMLKSEIVFFSSSHFFRVVSFSLLLGSRSARLCALFCVRRPFGLLFFLDSSRIPRQEDEEKKPDEGRKSG